MREILSLLGHTFMWWAIVSVVIHIIFVLINDH